MICVKNISIFFQNIVPEGMSIFFQKIVPEGMSIFFQKIVPEGMSIFFQKIHINIKRSFYYTKFYFEEN